MRLCSLCNKNIYICNYNLKIIKRHATYYYLRVRVYRFKNTCIYYVYYIIFKSKC